MLITPVSFFLGYAPGAYLLFGAPVDDKAPFTTVLGITLLTSVFCISVGQWVLSSTRRESST